MPTVGKIVANVTRSPLKSVVASHNFGSPVKMMKANGALTEAGKQRYMLHKLTLALKPNASVEDVLNATARRLGMFLQK